ncbi:MAG: hypothetical protein WBD46_02480 [Acidobacteriaceae bacterium]
MSWLAYPGLGLLAMCWMLTAGVPAQTANNRAGSEHAPAANAGGIIPMPPDRAEDSYAIYALLMGDRNWPACQPGATRAIAEVTVNDPDRDPRVPPQGQLKPPPDNPNGFNEAVGDYEANKNIRVKLDEEGFRPQHSFPLVDPQAAKSAGTTYFSEVYFDKKHRAALVYMSEWCANLASAGTWVYLEKQGGQWVRRSGIVVPGA